MTVKQLSNPSPSLVSFPFIFESSSPLAHTPVLLPSLHVLEVLTESSAWAKTTMVYTSALNPKHSRKIHFHLPFSLWDRTTGSPFSQGSMHFCQAHSGWRTQTCLYRFCFPLSFLPLSQYSYIIAKRQTSTPHKGLTELSYYSKGNLPSSTVIS